MIEIYKNDMISSDTFTDLSGNTDQLRAGAGTRRLNVDFVSGDYEADEDEVLSTALVCDICGIPVKKKSELSKSDGFYRCRDCIDED